MTPWATLANSAACSPVRVPLDEAEGDEAHVRDRGVGDEPLEVALDEAGQSSPDDADDAEDGEDRARPPRSRRAPRRAAAGPGRRCPS